MCLGVRCACLSRLCSISWHSCCFFSASLCPPPPPRSSTLQALVVEDADFQLILRVLNTNVNGTRKVMYALAQIRGIGRRFANLICKKAEIDLNKRAGELTEEELDTIKTIIANPLQFNIPQWFLNNQKDHKDGKYTQVVSNFLDTKLRDNLERMKKVRVHRGLRHYWGLRVRGQHTKTTGRKGARISVLANIK